MTKGRTALGIAIVVLLCVALGVYGWMSIHGIDTRQFWYIFVTGVGPIIALLWNNRVTAQVADKVEQIEENTNGKLTARIQEVVRTQLHENLKDEVLEQPENQS